MTRWLWIAGAVAVLVACALRWADFMRAGPMPRPPAPTEYNQPQFAGYWNFLTDARRLVPNGSSYTIKGPSPNDETMLFFISQGLYVGVEPRPATYVWQAQPNGGRDAKFVLVYGSAQCPADSLLIHEVKGGAVCRR